MPNLAEKRARFHDLHRNGLFVMANPWDVGSTIYLGRLGFPALATTSAGFAYTRGLLDGAIPRDVMLAHIAEIVAATDLPVNADFENGYADDPAGVADSVARCVAAGVAGLSIEDYTGRAADPLYEIELATARIAAARQAIDASGGGVVFTGRCEGFLRGQPDLAATIVRLKRYADAGADCLYAPLLPNDAAIAAVVAAVAPKPVNVLVAGPTTLTVARLRELGVRRISTGSVLARAAWGGLMRAATEIGEAGTFARLTDAASSASLAKAFGTQ